MKEQNDPEGKNAGEANDEKMTHEQKQNTGSVEKEAVDVLADKRLDKTVTADGSGKNIVSNPDDLLVVTNKERNLPADYIPEDLVYPNIPFPFEGKEEKMMLRKEAAAALEDLFKKAKEDKINLYAQSGYRSYERQEAIFASNSERVGEEKANRVSARAGQSEHQTGLTMDVTSPAVDYKLVEDFENTVEGKWVKDHAHEFGFIIRYPKGKESITGYNYEPWHLRYVGKEHAKMIQQKGITLEEYLQPKHKAVNK
ncbi:D-alanyl-D-alanine carboxypeptidase [Pueribacillus theae]|uniref:D-alanyl-D-alanine carboxypeptidase n=1 Tax=Pueribacillus theae TaxID=2171751 RepID=A0A2U1K7B5_9BACI|nr:M15 family metallopeptidase [Pueribacillus theae]PWA13282.1 D-alanyl-D-alanine carboxypeptidase [Pueribacillus theae]